MKVHQYSTRLRTNGRLKLVVAFFVLAVRTLKWEHWTLSATYLQSCRRQELDLSCCWCMVLCPWFCFQWIKVTKCSIMHQRFVTLLHFILMKNCHPLSIDISTFIKAHTTFCCIFLFTSPQCICNWKQFQNHLFHNHLICFLVLDEIYLFTHFGASVPPEVDSVILGLSQNNSFNWFSKALVIDLKGNWKWWIDLWTSLGQLE